MHDQPPPRRRFQFSLRTLMIVVTLLAVPLGYVGWQAKIVRARAAMLKKVASKGGGFVTAREGRQLGLWVFRDHATISTIREWLGDEAIDEIYIPYRVLDVGDFRTAFPEAVVHN